MKGIAGKVPSVRIELDGVRPGSLHYYAYIADMPHVNYLMDE